MTEHGSGTLVGKLCLVTGANAGMGQATAIALAGQGAEVVLASRDAAKAQHAADAFAAACGRAPAASLWGDLSSQAQVRGLARQFLARFERLDVLVNNAGMLDATRTLTEDGIERTFAVNHLAPFLLTHELLDALERTAQGRVVTVASDVHRMAAYDPGNLQLERGYGAYKAYCLSKLCNIMFTHELAGRLAGTRVTANCCHPGYVGSNFGSRSHPVFKLLMVLSRPFLSSPARGARTAIYLASAPDLGETSGQYFSNLKVVRPTGPAFDDSRTRELWEISERMTGVSSATASSASR